ncbi:MAG: hypothetical protein AAF682_20070 [Planctomycetota bacterium]
MLRFHLLAYLPLLLHGFAGRGAGTLPSDLTSDEVEARLVMPTEEAWEGRFETNSTAVASEDVERSLTHLRGLLTEQLGDTGGVGPEATVETFRVWYTEGQRPYRRTSDETVVARLPAFEWSALSEQVPGSQGCFRSRDYLVVSGGEKLRASATIRVKGDADTEVPLLTEYHRTPAGAGIGEYKHGMLLWEQRARQVLGAIHFATRAGTCRSAPGSLSYELSRESPYYVQLAEHYRSHGCVPRKGALALGARLVGHCEQRGGDLRILQHWLDDLGATVVDTEILLNEDRSMVIRERAYIVGSKSAHRELQYSVQLIEDRMGAVTLHSRSLAENAMVVDDRFEPGIAYPLKPGGRLPTEKDIEPLVRAAGTRRVTGRR